MPQKMTEFLNKPGAKPEREADLDDEFESDSETGLLNVSLLRLEGATARAEGAQENLKVFRRTWGNAIPDETTSEFSSDVSTQPDVKPINRAAVYPKSHMLHFSVLAALVLFEGLANAYFFSTGSDLGLLGGWLQAITVSFTNVITAFFLIGFIGLRLMANPHKRVHQILGAGVIALTTIALLALNLSAAHYRDLMELHAATLAMGGAEQTGVILDPVQAAWNNMTGLKSLEALLLFILGTTFAAIAAYKGRTFSDAIMGYAGATRKLEKASEGLMKALEEAAKDKDVKKMKGHDLLTKAQVLNVEILRELEGPART